MALVSISEAARLTGKSRSTIQRHIRQGKLSQMQDDTGTLKLDISELLRVYGSFATCSDTGSTIQHNTPNNLPNDTGLITRLAVLEAENTALKNHISSLNKALTLLENKQEKSSTEEPRRKWWQWFK